VLRNSMTGSFVYERGDRRDMPDFNVFFRYYASYPYYSDCIWFLTQMRRWGQLRADQPDEWYFEKAKEIYRPELYMEAAQLLIEEGNLAASDIPTGTDGFRAPTGQGDFIDDKVYDGHKPNDYIKSFTIKSE